MNRGWISLYRKVQAHWIWNDKPFDKRSAWIDLILLANHEDKKIVLGNEIIEVKRGSFVTSEVKLSDKWGWSRSKVRSFLELLENDKMIAKESDNKKTTISIVNYSVYQDSENNKANNDLDNEKTSKKHQKDTSNNINNINNKNNNTYMSDSNEYRLAAYLYKYILKNNPNAREPNLQMWAKHFDYILRIDKRPIEEVKEIIKFSQQHEFWHKNILSSDKLRKQYDRLILEMKNKKCGTNNNDDWRDF